MARSINTGPLKALVKPKSRKHIRTGNITEKIAASVLFNSELINRISNEEKPRIQVAGLKMIATYFESYVDNLARINPSKFHHIYEPDMAGMKAGRLFESSITASSIKPNLTYTFLPSTKPPESGYVFKNKAYVMENQIPLTITARNAEYLRFEYEGEFYSKKTVFVAEPGGSDVGGAFVETFNTFMTSMAGAALADLGFFERIEKGIANESRIALARVSAGKIEGMASEASRAANNIVRRLK
jgi:hypothetical protein